jgi:hypothetical protein
MIRLFRRRHRHPNVVFVDDNTREVLPTWAIRAGMFIVQTDYEFGTRNLMIRVQRTKPEPPKPIAHWTNVSGDQDGE